MAKNNGACSCSMAGGRCTCGSEDACQDIPGDACVSSGGSAISKPNKPIRPQRRSQSRYSGYSPPPYTIAGGAKYGSLPTFVYNCDSRYLGSQLEESNWNPLDLFRNKCKNACSGHEKNSAEWHGCMDVCKFEEERKKISQDGGSGGGWWKDIFGTQPAIDSCEAECPCGDTQSWAKCDECVAECQNRKSQAGQFVESEGGFLAVLDKLGGMFSKAKGWGQGDAGSSGLSDNEWKLRDKKEKNKRLMWGIAIFVFLIVIIGFVIFMARKKK